MAYGINGYFFTILYADFTVFFINVALNCRIMDFYESVDCGIAYCNKVKSIIHWAVKKSYRKNRVFMLVVCACHFFLEFQNCVQGILRFIDNFKNISFFRPDIHAFGKRKYYLLPEITVQNQRFMMTKIKPGKSPGHA